MKIFVFIVAVLLALVGALNMWGALDGEDKSMRKVCGAAGVVALIMAAVCFLSLLGD